MKKISAKKTPMKKVERKLPGSELLKKINFPVVASVLVVAIGLLAGYRFGLVAIVNGRPVSRIAYIRSLEKQAGAQTLDRMVTETLIFGEAAKKGVKIDQKTVDAEIAKIEEQLKTQGQTLDSALQAEGMSKKDLENQIRLQKIAEQLAGPGAQVTDEQIKQFLDTNKAQLPKGASQDELNNLAKTQLQAQAKNEAISTWLSNLRNSAKIVYTDKGLKLPF